MVLRRVLLYTDARCYRDLRRFPLLHHGLSPPPSLPLPAPSPTNLPQPPSPPLPSLSSLSSLLCRQTSSMLPPSQDLDHLHPPPNHIFPFLSSPMASSPHRRLSPLFPCRLCSLVLQPWGSTVSPKSRPSPPCFLSLTFAIDFIRQHHRRPLRLLRSLSPPQPWHPLLILAATGVFPYLSVFFPPALLPLPYPSTTEPRRRPGSSSSPSWPTTRRLLLSPSSPSLPPVTSPISSPSAHRPRSGRPPSSPPRLRRREPPLLTPPQAAVATVAIPHPCQLHGKALPCFHLVRLGEEGDEPWALGLASWASRNGLGQVMGWVRCWAGLLG